MSAILSLENISKSFNLDEQKVTILENISLPIEEKITTVIVGFSGSGKTTILNIINGIENIDSGTIHKKENISIGYVTQHANFIEELTIEQNLLLATYKKKDILNIYEIVEEFNCLHILKKKPKNLSGGEKQRINIIRGIILNPQLLILDEPTSSLDHDNKFKIINYLNNIQNRRELTIVLVTHDLEILDTIKNKQVFKISGKKLIPI